MTAVGPFRVCGRRSRLCGEVALCVLALAGVASTALAGEKSGGDAAAPATPAPGQLIRISLEPLGFQPVMEDYLLAGATGLTVDFVDNDHVLVTFNVRRLLKREPDEQAGDDDHAIAALLVELPSGKVLARTEWRLHDRLQYLWNLGHGRFLLRVRDDLTLLAPLERLPDGDAFRGTAVLDTDDRRIAAILVSSDQDLLTLETAPRRGGSAGVAGDVSFAGTSEAGVQISFYRLNDTPQGFSAEAAGVVRAPAPINVPMTRAGILDVLDGGKSRWLFNFNEHAGKVDELAEWDTTCVPRAQFVGHGEFVAFGCRGSEDKPEIAGFNLKGEEMWEQGLYDSYVAPQFAFAPAAGRFALERLIVDAPLDPDASVPAAAAVGEEVRVYQAETGKILLKVNTSPSERAGGNYALSPDGMRLAAFDQASRQRTTHLGDPYTQTATSLVIYPLPPLTDQDRAFVKEMEAKAPADTGSRIDASLARLASEDSAAAVALRSDAAPKAGPTAASRLGDAILGPRDAANSTAAAGPPPAMHGQEPGNPAMLGELPDAPGLTQESQGQTSSASADPQAGPRKAPTLYQAGEAPVTPGKTKGQ